MSQRILIVDDDAAVRAAARKLLEGAGYEVSTAADGREAETRIQALSVDLVLLDLNLPLASGWDVFERLTTRCPWLPVIIITGVTNQYRTALAAGASVLMEKPIDAAELLDSVQEVLREPKEARLRRLCGYQSDTKYLHSKEHSVSNNR
jgi:two-component system, OmpR family, response regulator